MTATTTPTKRRAADATPGVAMTKRQTVVAAPSSSHAVNPTTAEPSADQFARSVSLMAVAHVARGVGFESIQRSAGDAMAEILAAYIQRIGVATKEAAEHAGRTQPRATDVVMALHDMLPAPVDLPDLIKALQTAKRPFPRDIPSFPARKNDATSNALEQQNKIGSRDELPAYAPRFLPPLPHRHTYSADSRVVVDRERDPKRARLDLLGQKSHVQQSLHGLESAAVAPPPVALVQQQQAWNAFQGAASEQSSSNPFLQPPVLHGEKKTRYGSVEREFAPVVNREKNNKKSSLDSSSSSMAKLSSSQELGKEEKILTGIFHDGDSE